ncbi:MAG: carbon starvation protein A, partial [Bacteroidales bacterium]|nr:carbon starvation protein A [Bacteroidales bacterium]
MWSFLISLGALVLGYCLYGGFVERVWGPDASRKTPALTKADGVDYVPLPAWKVYMIQFLNIAGTGPIFGAIMGAKFGPSCYLWIVLGCIFAGAVHDYLSAMMSLENGGDSLPNVVGRYLGGRVKVVITLFIMLLMLLVGAVFVYSPALILGDLAGFMRTPEASMMFWVVVIFLYYVVATILPIDKVIGRVYPLFAVSLLFMAVAMLVCLLCKWPVIPEFWDGLHNRGPEVGLNGQSIFPCLFITVACGAISGFHATQSPLMTRCIKNEKLGRPIFYGAMVTEGAVALIWAAVSSYFFFDGGMQEVGAESAQAPAVVNSVARSWLGVAGGILALLGVVAAPITSGDTAFRSARLIVAEWLHIDQKSKGRRLLVSLPLFVLAALLLWYNMADENGFNT